MKEIKEDIQVMIIIDTSMYVAMVALLDPEDSLSFFIASNMRSSSL
jgi:hypothetical protein